MYVVQYIYIQFTYIYDIIHNRNSYTVYTVYLFRRKGVSVNELTNRRSWAHNYCEAKVLHRSNQRKKVEKYCDKHKIQDFKVTFKNTMKPILIIYMP